MARSRFLKEKDEQRGRRDAEENDGINQVIDEVSAWKIYSAHWRLQPVLPVQEQRKPLGTKLATIEPSAEPLMMPDKAKRTTAKQTSRSNKTIASAAGDHKSAGRMLIPRKTKNSVLRRKTSSPMNSTLLLLDTRWRALVVRPTKSPGDALEIAQHEPERKHSHPGGEFEILHESKYNKHHRRSENDRVLELAHLLERERPAYSPQPGRSRPLQGRNSEGRRRDALPSGHPERPSVESPTRRPTPAPPRAQIPA